MSRAFTRESDDPAPLPERAISAHPNLVTARGLEATLHAALAEVKLACRIEDGPASVPALILETLG